MKDAGSREQDSVKKETTSRSVPAEDHECDEEGREKIRRETERITRQVQAQVEENEMQGNDRSNQPDNDMEDQGEQSSPEDEEMPDACAGMTEQAEGTEGK